MAGLDEHAEQDSSAASPSYLLFEAAAIALAVPAEQVSRVHDALSIEPVDGTLSWFIGIAVADGTLLPVTDLGALLGRSVARGYILQLHSDVGVAGIRVESVLGLCNEPLTRQTHAEELPEVLGIDGEDGVLNSRGRQHHLLDFHALLQSPQLLNIASDA